MLERESERHDGLVYSDSVVLLHSQIPYPNERIYSVGIFKLLH